jgi:4-hydroxythreonine-4-phosphate dehydrogenase
MSAGGENPFALPPIALTMGEPSGIGGEVTLKAWRARRTLGPGFFIIADPDALSREAHALALDVPIAVIDRPSEAPDAFARALPVLPEPLARMATPGQPDTANAPPVIAAIRRAVAFTAAGEAAAVVTNPIHKKVLADSGFHHPGHTEFLGELTGTPHPIMMLACPGLRVVPVTVHLPLAEAIAALSTDRIVRAAEITARALTRDYAIVRPRLAIAALNPHGGEGGMLGSEDGAIIAPAVARLREAGIDAFGPAPADSLFHARARETYDAVICMYHDQALIPLKTVNFDDGVDVTLGLPIVRTSPDHGTAFEIAGKGIARESSLIAALVMAHDIAVNRSRQPGKRQP